MSVDCLQVKRFERKTHRTISAETRWPADQLSCREPDCLRSVTEEIQCGQGLNGTDGEYRANGWGIENLKARDSRMPENLSQLTRKPRQEGYLRMLSKGRPSAIPLKEFVPENSYPSMKIIYLRPRIGALAQLCETIPRIVMNIPR